MRLTLQVARAWKVPPTEVRSWPARDLLAAQAILVDNAQRHACGHSTARSTHPEMADKYQVQDDTTCYACRALGEYERLHRDDDPTPWRIVRVVETPDAPAHLEPLASGQEHYADGEVPPQFE